MQHGKSHPKGKGNEKNAKSTSGMGGFLFSRPKHPCLGLDLGQALGHKVKEGELAGLVAIFVDEATGQVGTEDGAEVVLGDLENVSIYSMR
jgi:hypothetical protein